MYSMKFTVEIKLLYAADGSWYHDFYHYHWIFKNIIFKKITTNKPEKVLWDIRSERVEKIMADLGKIVSTIRACASPKMERAKCLEW